MKDRVLPRAVAVLGWLAVAAAVVYFILRLFETAVAEGQGEPWPLFGFIDFRDTIYSPTRYLLAGHNPYNLPEYLQSHPNQQPFNVYLPLQFILFGWLALLPRDVAIVVFTLVNVTVLCWLVREGTQAARSASSFAARHAIWVLPWLLFLFVSRGPGFMTIRQGQIAVLLAAAAWLAIQPAYARWRWIGLTVALIKPQVGLSVALVLVAQRRWRDLILGGVAAAVLSLVPLFAVIRSAGGIGPFIDSVIQNLRYSMSDSAFLSSPVDVATTLDLIGLSSTLWPLKLILVLVAAALLLWTVARRSSAAVWDPNVLATAALATLLILPNQRYAISVLIPPVTYVCLRALEWAWLRRHALTIVATLLVLYVFLRFETLEVLAGLPYSARQWLPPVILFVGTALFVVATWRSGPDPSDSVGRRDPVRDPNLAATLASENDQPSREVVPTESQPEP